MKFPEHNGPMHITHNPHKSSYENAETYLANFVGFDPEEWLGEHDLQDAIANDSIWHVVWYPDTPIGSFTAYGSTLENALAVANRGDGDEA